MLNPSTVLSSAIERVGGHLFVSFAFVQRGLSGSGGMMMSAPEWSFWFGVGLLTLNLTSILFAVGRLHSPAHLIDRTEQSPVSIVRPLCGVDSFLQETIASTFSLNYREYEILFCAANAADPAIPVAQTLMDAHPNRPARLLIGDERINGNPKLNNCLKGWRAAIHDWIVIVDANVLMPPDYLLRVLAAWDSNAGLVCSAPISSRPQTLSAELECAFLNTLQARWHYVGERLGFGFAQGKNMLWRRDFLERQGGLAALAVELAEDAAATKIVHKLGLRVRLVDRPFEQPLGARELRDVWSRQLRWARLRRATFPFFFMLEIATNPILPTAAISYAAVAHQQNMVGSALIVLALWYGAEALLARSAHWRFGWKSPLAFLFRDLLMPMIWIAAWLGSDFEWRGHAMSVSAKRGKTIVGALSEAEEPPSAI